jgi:hypothetical protein
MNIVERVLTEDVEPRAVAQPGPFPVWKPSQFLEYTPPADAVILGDSLVERGKWTSLVGVGGLGKTRLALWLAVCQVLGRDWCGLKVHGKPLRWLILSTENGLRRWKTDLGAMLAGFNERQRAAIDENLRILALTDDEDGDLNTGNPESMRRLAMTLREHKPDAIVFDPFADIIDGDENKTEDVIITLRTLRHIVRKDAPTAAALLIHHSRTGAGNVAQAGDNFNAGNFGRGAKALYNTVRAEIQLAPGDRDDASKIVLACGKNSDGPKFAARGIIFDAESCSYSLNPDFDLDSWRADVRGQRTGKACTISDAVNAIRQLALMPEDEAKTGDTVRLMEDATGAGIRTCKARLSDAVKAGYLRKGSRTGLYRLGSKSLPR